MFQIISPTFGGAGAALARRGKPILQRRLLLGFIWCIALTPASTWALDPAKSIDQFNCENWTHQTVLPSDSVTAITQTKDGYIWLGTQKGLLRFDGLEFKSFPINFPQARGQEIRNISRSQNGGLWFTINNGSYGYFDGQNFSAIDDERWNVTSRGSISIRETRDGSVWDGTDMGYGRWVKDKPEDTFFQEQFGVVLSTYEDSHARVWLGTVETGLFYWQAGKMIPFPDESLKTHLVFAVAEDAKGQIWVGTETGLRCYDASLKPKEIPAFNNEVKALLVDRYGTLWIGTTGEGLARYQNDNFSFLKKEDGLANDNVTSLLEDTEGSIWVGTQDGLSQLTDVKFPIFSNGEGLIRGTIHSVAPSKKGGLWLTTSRGLAYFDGKTAINYTNLPNPWVKTAFESSNGNVYFADGLKSLQVLSGENITGIFTNDSLPSCITEDKDGLLVGVGPRLYRIKDNKPVPFDYKDGRKGVYYWINGLCVGKDGTIWVASNNGLVQIKDGIARQWANPDNIFSFSKAYWVFEDEDGAVWYGTLLGMGRIKDNELKSISKENGLFDNQIFAIVPDNEGNFWMDSSRGIFRVPRKSLNDFADGKIDRVKCEGFEGLKAVKYSGRTDQEPSGCKTADGRIWFPSPKGIVMIDSTNFFNNQVVPPVYITQILVNGVEVRDKKIPKLDPGGGRMEFGFTALSFIAPNKVQFRYRLVGFDAQWIDARGRRSVAYNNLKPGQYAFQVQACNADGVWNSAGDSFQIQLPLPFYKSLWFEAMCGIVSLLALWALYRWQVAQIEKHQRQLQEANDLLEAKVSRRTVQLATANAALRGEIAEREKADKALAEQRNLLRTLIDNIPDKVFIKDAKSRVLISNLAHASAMKIAAPDDMVGKSDFDFFTLPMAQKFFDDEQKLLKTGEVFHAEEKVVYLETGDPRWNQTTKVPLRDSTGAIIGLAGINRDITERKQWEARQDELHKKLVDASRRAGMAEVATGVLHNVGNVLNSVNVSAALAAQKVRKSKSTNLARIVDLLRQHETDLGHFLTEDEKGRHLPAYLATLTQHIEAERESLLSELESLAGNVDHIKEIVTMQQANAKLSGVVEIVPVDTLVEEALKINVAAFQRHEVSLIRKFDEVPPIAVDRHKVLQILINLLNNAKYACDESGRHDKEITVQINKLNGKSIQIGVIDNGTGIVPENLTRIFSHGFTTRKNGHGFGLHSGALAAMELGGKLTAFSKGRGYGASFILELPVENNPVNGN